MTWRFGLAPLARLAFLLALVVLAGCTEKAQALRIAAAQFETEAGAAISAIDDMRRQEVAPAVRSPSEQSQEFVAGLKKLSGTLDEKTVEVLLRPYDIEPNERVEKAWADFIGELRQQYAEFRSVFDRIEQASFTARNQVAAAKPFAEKLTAQMAFLAQEIGKNPPKFLQQRTALIDELRKIRASGTDEASAARWRDRWIALEENEVKLQRGVVAQLLKAATIGREVRDKIAAYDQLSVEEIGNGIAGALRLAETITGDDLSELRGRSQNLMSEINNDPVWNSVAQSGLAKIKTMVDARAAVKPGS